MNHKPTSITLDKSQGHLEIVWDDRLVSRYPLSHLREACPCCEYRVGDQNMGLEHAPDDILTLTPRRSYVIADLRPVGNYAIQPTWDDSHATGIYTWEYLRLISPPQPGE